jgi:hypothetical protein
MNSTQTVAFICAETDILLVDFQKKTKVDLDELLIIGEIKACINEFEKFYILANKLHKT